MQLNLTFESLKRQQDSLARCLNLEESMSLVKYSDLNRSYSRAVGYLGLGLLEDFSFKKFRQYIL